MVDWPLIFTSAEGIKFKINNFTSLAKTQLRTNLLNKQRESGRSLISAFGCFSNSFVNQVYDIMGLKETKNIFVYLNGPCELPLTSFITTFLESGHSIYVPHWSQHTSNELLKYIPIFSIDEISSFSKIGGIPVPALQNQTFTLSLPDVVFIPAVAYDYKGNRLGRGSGHFDKYLSSLTMMYPSKTPILIGVIHREYYFHDTLLPNETHDIPVQYLITSNEELIKIE